MNRGDKVALAVAGAGALGLIGYSIYNALKPKGLSVVRMTILPYQNSILVGNVQNLQATAYYSDGSAKDVTADLFWVSSNQAVAVVQYPGGIQGIAPGSTNIEVNYLGITGVALISVT